MQIERIYTSIQGLVDPDSLEKIQHFRFSPWEYSTPYQVKISKLPKANAAVAHNQHINTAKNTKTKSIYTDASALPD
jgi:hypothetical protein